MKRNSRFKFQDSNLKFKILYSVSLGILFFSILSSGVYASTGNWVCGQDLDNDGYVDAEGENAQCISTAQGHLCPVGAVDCTGTFSDAICPAGSSLNTATDKCEAQTQISCKTGFTYVEDLDVCVQDAACSNNGLINTVTDKCEIVISDSRCPSGYTWSSVNNACISNVSCPSGGIYNVIRDRCEAAASYKCPSGYTYNSSANKCETSPVCSNGTYYNASTDRCEKNAEPQCPSGYTYNALAGRCEVTVTCPPGSTLNGSTDKCEATASPVCPSGYAYNSSTRKCEVLPSCQSGTTYNTTLDKCVVSPTPTCASGFTYDSSNRVCYQSATCSSGGTINTATDRCEVAYTCPSGTTFNTNTDKCERASSVSCPSGTTLSGSVCVVNPTCSSGSTYNPSTDRCELGVSYNCPSRMTYNSSTGKCETNPTCPSGFTYSTTANMCVQSATIGCPSGYTYNASTGRCEYAPPTCPAGGSYSNANDRCEVAASLSYTCPMTEQTFSSQTTCQSNCIQTANCVTESVSFSGRVPVNLRYSIPPNYVEGSGNALHFYACWRHLDEYSHWHYYCDLVGTITASGVTFSGTIFAGYEARITRIVGRGDRLDFYTHDGKKYIFIGSIYVSGATVLGDFDDANIPSAIYRIDVSGHQWIVYSYYNDRIRSGTFTFQGPATCPLGNHPCNNNSPPTCSISQGCTTNISCPSGYTLSGSLCIANASCSGGGTLNGVTDTCEITPTVSCPSGATYDAALGMCVANATCPSGGTLNGSTDKCEATATTSCPSGFTQSGSICYASATCSVGSLNTAMNRCETSPTYSCLSGYTLSGTTCQINPSCVSGYSFNGATDKCEYSPPTCSGSSYNTARDRCEVAYSNSCPSGTTYNATSGYCEVSSTCPSGGSLNTGTDKCEAVTTYSCGSGLTYNSSTGKCEASPGCPSGGGYNPSLDRCTASNTWICSSGTLSGSICYVSATCPSGGTLNGSTDKCEATATPQCAADYTYDSGLMLCYKAVICPSSGILDAILDKCKVSASSICPSAYSYNSSTQRCEYSPPTCREGASYSTTIDKCVIEAVHACPIGMSYSPSTRLCETLPACAAGAYDSTAKKCYEGNNTCPLGSQYTCMSSDGRNRCSPNQCVNLDTTPAVEDEDVDDEVLQDDGPRDAEGNCLGTVYIFRGKSMKCRPSGYKTGFTNCCNKSQGVISDSVTGITGISTIGALKAGYDIIKTGAIAAKIGAGELQIMTYSKDLVVITKGATGEVVHTLTKLQAQAFEGIPLSTGTVGIPGGADAAVNQVMSNWATNLGPQIALAAVTMAIQDPVLSSTVNLIGTALMGGGPIGIALAVVNLAMSIFTEKCTPQDIETSTLNDSKYCHYVGDYCESKWPLIGCVQRAKRFCCFNSKLARIIHEQGRPQLSAFSRGWGSAKSPNCRGFKPEEFQMLDFSKMDLSEYFRDIQKDINQKIQKVQSNATQKIQQFYQNTK